MTPNISQRLGNEKLFIDKIENESQKKDKLTESIQMRLQEGDKKN